MSNILFSPENENSSSDVILIRAATVVCIIGIVGLLILAFFNENLAGFAVTISLILLPPAAGALTYLFRQAKKIKINQGE